nr:RNA-directed DNA polymerase, eukaryota [Tanacetum cinerariifolium]
QVLGVGVHHNIVNQAALLIGCAVMQNPFQYLGVMVGDSMSRKLSWADTVLGASPLYNMSIYKVPKGVLKEIEAIRTYRGRSVFDQPLCVRFPRLFGLETDKESTVASKLGSSLIDASFRRSVRDGVERQQWDDLNSVSEVRTILDDNLLPSAAVATRWVKYIPIKINVFAWRARLDPLPTRSNIVRRGVVLDSSLCPLCGLVPKDIHHVLFWCDMAKLIFRWICLWWDLDWHDLLSFSDWNAWFSAIRTSPKSAFKSPSQDTNFFASKRTHSLNSVSPSSPLSLGKLQFNNTKT